MIFKEIARRYSDDDLFDAPVDTYGDDLQGESLTAVFKSLLHCVFHTSAAWDFHSRHGDAFDVVL